MTCITRSLVIGSNWKRDKNVLRSMLDLSHVRSLTVFGDWKPFLISDVNEGGSSECWI